MKLRVICSFSTVNTPLINRQLKWEPIKYKMQKFTMNNTKHIAEEKQ